MIFSSGELPRSSMIAEAYYPIAKRYAPAGYDPVRSVKSGEGRMVYPRCLELSNPKIARDLSQELRMQLKTVMSDHPKPVSTHIFMEDQATRVIVDPAAMMFFRTLPEEIRQKYFIGTMFIGTREELLRIFQDNGVKLHNISTYNDKELSMRRIYGDNGKIAMFRTDDEQRDFYGY